MYKISIKILFQVLGEFRQLHRLAKKVFVGDAFALSAAQKRITEDFRKNKHVTNQGSIQELLNLAKDVRNELKTNVIQAKQKTPGVYGQFYTNILIWIW